LFTEIGLGMLNVLLLTPFWLQILHLLLADTIWISLVLTSAALVLEEPNATPGRVAAAFEFTKSKTGISVREGTHFQGK
jgi:hypothetical protein